MLVKEKRRVSGWRILAFLIVAWIAFAIFAPDPPPFGALWRGERVGESGSWHITSGDEKTSVGSYNFKGNYARVFAQLKEEAASDGLTEITADPGSGRIRLTRPGESRGFDDHVDFYPDRVVSRKRDTPKSELIPMPGSFAVRFRISRPLSFLEALPLRIFNVYV